MTDAVSALSGGRRLTGLIVLGTAGVTTFLAMPAVAAALAGNLGLSDKEIGFFSTIQLITLSLGCVVSVFLPRRDARGYGFKCLVTMLVCDCICLTNPGWKFFLAIRAIGGFAGGIAVSQATKAMSFGSNSERNFGLFLALQTIVSIAAVYAIPLLVGLRGFGASYSVMIVMDVLALALLHRDRREPEDQSRFAAGLRGRNDTVAWMQSAALLASMLCFFIGVGALWTFLALLGERIGLSGAQVASAISFSKLAAFAASFLPGMISTRQGRALPIVAAVFLLLLSVQWLTRAAGFGAFVGAVSVFAFGWYTLYPFQLGALASVDSDGRPMLASAALTGIGLGIGPSLAMTGPHPGPSSIYFTASTAFVAAAVMALLGLGVSRLFAARSQP